MTIEKLSQLRNLNREVEQYERRLAKMEAVLAGAEAKIDGLPHVVGVSGNKALTESIVAIKGIIEMKIQMCVKEYNQLMQFIISVEDSYMRQLLAFRYIDGLSWLKVALRLGGGNTEASVYMAHKRFLNKQQSR